MTDINEVREYWDRQPCNSKHSSAPKDTLRYSNEVEHKRYKAEPHLLPFMGVDYLSLFPGSLRPWAKKKILEVGCGIGTDALMFAKAGANVTVTELSEESLLICLERFRLHWLSVGAWLCNAEELSNHIPVSSINKYDLIYCCGVLHHTPNPEKAIEQIKLYMNENSEFRLLLYSKYSLKAFMIWLGLSQPEAQANCPIARTYSFKEVRELLKDFDIISMEKAHIFPYSIPEYKRGEFKKAFPWNIIPDRIRFWLAKYIGWHTLIVAKLKQVPANHVNCRCEVKSK